MQFLQPYENRIKNFVIIHNSQHLLIQKGAIAHPFFGFAMAPFDSNVLVLI